MRPARWMLVTSALLFVGSLVFAVAGLRAVRGADAADASTLTPVATVDQIMDAIVIPASTVVFRSVGTTATASGIEERRPKSDEEWEHVAASAAALAEAGNLLLMDGRAEDAQEWAMDVHALTDAARAALAATAARDPERLLTAGGVIDEACDRCHRRYQTP